jgi:hypothetical protein
VNASEYSDEALRKQAALENWPEGKPVPTEMLLGVVEPRTQPQAHERCERCGSDARDGEGGHSRLCWLCYSRGEE